MKVVKEKARSSEEWKELGRSCWSFSRLNAFAICPKMYELTYVKGMEGVPNFFAEFGSFVHQIYEMYVRKELRRNQLQAYYKAHWDECVVTPAPYSEWVDYESNWYRKGLAAMANPPSLKEYEILGVEEEVHFKIDGEDAVGFIDLLLRRKKDGAVIVVDHKSGKSVKILKNGKVSKPDREKFAAYRRQLYLYSTPVIEKYGRVDALTWNFFNDGVMHSIPWTQEEYDETLAWASTTRKSILKCRRWKKVFSDFFCANICSQRENC